MTIHSQRLVGFWDLQLEPRAGLTFTTSYLLDDHPVVAMHGEPKTPSQEGLNIGPQGCIQTSAPQLAAGERDLVEEDTEGPGSRFSLPGPGVN